MVTSIYGYQVLRLNGDMATIKYIDQPSIF